MKFLPLIVFGFFNALPAGILAAGLGPTANETIITESSSAASAAPREHPLETLARRNGVRQCSETVKRFAPSLVGLNGRFGLLPVSGATNSDAPFAVAIEEVLSEPWRSRWMHATFSPAGRSDCDLSIQIVEFAPTSCEDFARDALGAPAALAVIAQRIRFLKLSSSHYVFLTRVPGGCVATSTQTVSP